MMGQWRHWPNTGMYLQIEALFYKSLQVFESSDN